MKLLCMPVRIGLDDDIGSSIPSMSSDDAVIVDY